jgi:acyl transferase domain-containing protein
MFPGGGAQYPGMGRELYETEPSYREALDECLNALPPELALNLRRLLLSDCDLSAGAAELERPSLSVTSVFVTEYAMAKLLLSWGLEPAAMIGHSLGEYLAATLAGVMTTRDALALIALRGRLFEPLPPAPC